MSERVFAVVAEKSQSQDLVAVVTRSYEFAQAFIERHKDEGQMHIQAAILVDGELEEKEE